MTSYTIAANAEFKSIEITFDGKPSEAIRTALKNLRFRWHNVKKVWYGYTDEQTVTAAIANAESPTVSTRSPIVTERMDWQFSNALSPTVLVLLGIVIACKA